MTSKSHAAKQLYSFMGSSNSRAIPNSSASSPGNSSVRALSASPSFPASSVGARLSPDGAPGSSALHHNSPELHVPSVHTINFTGRPGRYTQDDRQPALRRQDSNNGRDPSRDMYALEFEKMIQTRIKARRMRHASWFQRSVCCSCWSDSPSFSWLVSPVLDFLSVNSELERLYIREYYVRITEEYETRAKRMGWWLYHLQVIRTTFNVILPAVLALQNLGKLAETIMWLTWGLSLAVSLSTGYIDLFRMRDLFEQFTRASELLKLEGWRFFGLTGRYAVFAKHQDALPAFFGRVALIRRKMIDEEFPPGKAGSPSVTGSNSKSSSVSPVFAQFATGTVHNSMMHRNAETTTNQRAVNASAPLFRYDQSYNVPFQTSPPPAYTDVNGVTPPLNMLPPRSANHHPPIRTVHVKALRRRNKSNSRPISSTPSAANSLRPPPDVTSAGISIEEDEVKTTHMDIGHAKEYMNEPASAVAQSDADTSPRAALEAEDELDARESAPSSEESQMQTVSVEIMKSIQRAAIDADTPSNTSDEE